MERQRIHQLGRDSGFDLVGLARIEPGLDFVRFRQWLDDGHAAGMGYLSDHRAGLRTDPRLLLPAARSVICVGKLYNGPEPLSSQYDRQGSGWISRYAWGDDYHGILRSGLERFRDRIAVESGPFESKICVDTAPLLERSYARQAGLGWIGRNTCLINEGQGSWFFLGELLVSLDFDEVDSPPPDRCGTCTACIDACPTGAIAQQGPDQWVIQSELCISYQTIELRGNIDEKHRVGIGRHLFGCDICQDVCPWNRRAPCDCDSAFRPRAFAPDLNEMAALDGPSFRARFGSSAVTRARYRGFLRNVAVAMGNSGAEQHREALERLASHDDPVIAEHAVWALRQP